jgi:hypothetical protein
MLSRRCTASFTYKETKKGVICSPAAKYTPQPKYVLSSGEGRDKSLRFHHGASFTASWFIDGNLAPLFAKFLPVGWSAERSKQVVYIHNALANNSRMT